MSRKKKDNDDEFVELNDTFMGLMRKLEDGDFANHAGAEVQALFAKLRAVAANKNAHAKGTITLTLTVNMSAEGYGDVNPTIKTKAPEFKRRSSVVFVDEEGDLMSRPAEKQQSLFAVEGTADLAPAKDPAQPAVKGL